METTPLLPGQIPTAHRSRITRLQDGRATWLCECGKGSKTPASSDVKALACQSRHIQAARAAEAAAR